MRGCSIHQGYAYGCRNCAVTATREEAMAKRERDEKAALLKRIEDLERRVAELEKPK